MRIALTGASSTGKTTLLNDLLMTPMFKQHGIINVQLNIRGIIDTIGIQADGRGTNYRQRRKFQWTLLEKKTLQESSHVSYVTDRSTVDMAAYWIVRDTKGPLDTEGEKYLTKCREIASKYDFHIHLPFGAIPFVSDGQRPSSEIYNKKTCEAMKGLLEQWELPHISLTQSGREERVEEVVSYLQNK
ncbi:MAG: ATP-binding protein [Desulfuromonadales bacterium]|nr:ATP-binding protein [Desulfuromonadales bacterium]